MTTNTQSKVLRIYISNTDKFKHIPLYETIVYAAKRYKMAGATVLKGNMGFGASSTVYSQKFWEITEKLPIVIEIIDETTNIDAFIEIIRPWFNKLRYGCLITTENVNLVLYKEGGNK